LLKKVVNLNHKQQQNNKSMEINVQKSTKESRIGELMAVNKMNGIKQTKTELRKLSYDQINNLLIKGYDKFGTGFKMKFQ
jgi:hypothetical protein